MALVYIDLFSDDAQGLKRTDASTIAAGAANTLAIRVSHDGEHWSGLDGYARFEYQSAVYDVPISSDGVAVVPWEVVKYPAFIVSLWGEDGEGGILTTERVSVKVERSIDLQGVEPIPSSPTLADMFNARANQALDIASSVQDRADAGEFNGKDFTIVKIYATVAAMQADTSGDVQEGQFVVIQSGTDTAADDGKVYKRTSSGWEFVGHVGAPGADGAAATIQVAETITGEPGTNASVENIGSENVALLRFTIPRGEDGADGGNPQIGAANLYVGTSDFSGDEWFKPSATTDTNPDRRGNAVVQFTSTTQPASQWVYLTAGENVTISATVRPTQTASSTLKFKAWLVEGVSGQSTPSGEIAPASAPAWSGTKQIKDISGIVAGENRVAATFTVTSTGWASVGILNTATSYRISSIMVERADTPADWYPAASDTLGGGAVVDYPITIDKGGTGATTAADARTSLGAAASTHEHSAADITSGTLPLTRGGTGATTAADARTSLGAAAASHTHTDIMQIQTVEVTIASTTKGGNTNGTATTPTVSGYAPIGIVGYTAYTGTRQNWLNLWKLYLEDNTVYISACNMHASDAASATIRVYVLYQRA